MGAAKAAAGGVAGALSDFITYLLTTYVPFLDTIPNDQKQNLEFIVTAAVVAAAVYLTPNAPSVPK